MKNVNTASGYVITIEAGVSGRVGTETRLRGIEHQVSVSSSGGFMGCPSRHSSASSGAPDCSQVRFRVVRGSAPSVRARYERDKSRANLATKWQLPGSCRKLQGSPRFVRPLNPSPGHQDRGGGDRRVLSVALANRSTGPIKNPSKGAGFTRTTRIKSVIY